MDVAIGLREADVVVGVRVRTEVGLVARRGQIEVMPAAPVKGKENKASEKRSTDGRHNHKPGWAVARAVVDGVLQCGDVIERE